MTGRHRSRYTDRQADRDRSEKKQEVIIERKWGGYAFVLCFVYACLSERLYMCCRVPVTRPNGRFYVRKKTSKRSNLSVSSPVAMNYVEMSRRLCRPTCKSSFRTLGEALLIRIRVAVCLCVVIILFSTCHRLRLDACVSVSVSVGVSVSVSLCWCMCECLCQSFPVSNCVSVYLSGRALSLVCKSNLISPNLFIYIAPLSYQPMTASSEVVIKNFCSM